MIVNADQAQKIYRMLRPNGGASQDEINGTAGRRTFANFLNDAQPEIAARDANLRAQAEALAAQSNTINAQNQTITDLNAKLNDATLSNAEKQKALDEAMLKIADQNAEITNAHDQLKDLQESLPKPEEPAKTNPAPAADAGPFVKLLAAIFARFGKK